MQYRFNMKKLHKFIMRAKDEFEFLKIFHEFHDMIFDYEYYRIQLILFMQLANITNNRLNVFLIFRY